MKTKDYKDWVEANREVAKCKIGSTEERVALKRLSEITNKIGGK